MCFLWQIKKQQNSLVMKKLILALSAGMFLLAGTSCKKDDKNCAVTVANIAGTYKVQKVMYKLNATTPEVDYTSTVFEPCELDDLHVLNANGTYSYQLAGVDCAPPQTPATVSSFDCSTLNIVFADYNVAGDKATFTLKKQ